MPRQKAGNENIRKIQKTGQGGGSYMLTLPKQYIEKLGWREHQKVEVELKGKSLIITDWK